MKIKMKLIEKLMIAGAVGFITARLIFSVAPIDFSQFNEKTVATQEQEIQEFEDYLASMYAQIDAQETND